MNNSNRRKLLQRPHKDRLKLKNKLRLQKVHKNKRKLKLLVMQLLRMFRKQKTEERNSKKLRLLS